MSDEVSNSHHETYDQIMKRLIQRVMFCLLKWVLKSFVIRV